MRVLDLAIVLAFLGLLAIAIVIGRRLSIVTLATGLAFGVAGNAVQFTTTLGVGWTARSLQALGLACALAVVLVAWRTRPTGRRGFQRSVFGILVPAGVLALSFTGLRLLSDAAPLTAVGYLVNHPQAEDNAKWLHLTSQLAQGTEVTFNGYAGGPLLLFLAMVAAAVSVMSTVLLGGVNEVAVAANSVVIGQYVLLCLAPFALAPLVEGRLRLHRMRRSLPLPAVFLGAGVLVLASAVVTSYGHLSLQWVLLVLVFWSAAFAAERGQALLLGSTLTVVTVASVWIPLNVLGLVLAVGAIIWSVRARRGALLAVSLITLAVSTDALVSSTLFLLGFSIDFGLSGDTGEAGAGGASIISGHGAGDSALTTAASLFTAPGGVEQIAPIVAMLAGAAVLATAWSRRPRVGWTLAPIGILGGYVLLVQLADAVTTGGAPHYGGHKLVYAVTIAALCSTLPIAISSLGSEKGMTGTRWAATGIVVFLLMADTMLPRAISALSPKLWPSNAAESPTYWSVAEVRPAADQPISSLPIACLFAPPATEVPSALPLGQESYSCTRLLIGLAGLEGEAGGIDTWLARDWLGQRPTWADAAPSLAGLGPELLDRPVALMTETGGTAGFTTLRALLASSPVPAP